MLKKSLCARIEVCKSYQPGLLQGENKILLSAILSLLQTSSLPLVASPRLCMSAMECSALCSRSNKAEITHLLPTSLHAEIRVMLPK